MLRRVFSWSVLLVTAVMLTLTFVERSTAAQLMSYGSFTADGVKALWVGEFKEINGIDSDKERILLSFPAEQLEDLVVDNQRGVLWIATRKYIVKYAQDGSEMLRIPVPDNNRTSNGTDEVSHRHKQAKNVRDEEDEHDKKGDDKDAKDRGGRTHLSLDPSNGSLWAGRNDSVLKVDENGTALLRMGASDMVHALSVDISDGSCWVGTKRHVLRYDKDGRRSLSVKLEEEDVLQAMASDPGDNGLWIGSDRGLVRIGRTGLTTFRTRSVRDVQDLRLILSTGSVWAITKKEVWKLGKEGSVLLSRQMCPDSDGHEPDRHGERCKGSDSEHQERDEERENDDRDHGDRDDHCEGNLVVIAVDQVTGGAFAAWRKKIVQISGDGVALRWLKGFKQIEALDTGLPRLAVQINAPVEGDVIDGEQVTVTGSVSDPAAAVTVNGRNAVNENGSFSIPDFPLIIGGNTITATAVNIARLTESDAVQVTRRSAQPPFEIQIDSPQDGAMLVTARTDVKGTLNGPGASVVVNNVQAEVIDSSFIAQGVPLSPGNNTLNAYGVDEMGRSATDSVMVTYPWIDLQVLYPYSGDRFSLGDTEVEAWVSDPAAQATVNGREAAVEGNTVYSSGVPLAPGWNDITVQAANEWGQVDEETVSVLHELPAAKPVMLQVLAPDEGALIGSAVFEVVGSVNDPFAEVIVNDVPAQVEDGMFRAIVHACDEMEMVPETEWCSYTITVYGRSGSTATEWRTYRYDPMADAIMVTVQSYPGTVVTASPALIAGWVHDSLAEITPPMITVNDIPADLQGDRFEAMVPLDDGWNDIVVKATDLVGHEAYDVVRLVYEPLSKPLAVSITSPAAGGTVNTPTVAVSGILSDSTAAVTVNDNAAQKDFRSFRALATGLTLGENTISVTAARSNGEAVDAVVTVTYDPFYPSPPAPQLSDVPAFSRSPFLDIAGLSLPGHVVEVFVDGTAQTLTQSDSAGLFTVSVQLAADGPHHLAARTMDAWGNRSMLSQEKVVVRDVVSPPLANIAFFIDSLNLRVSRVFLSGGTEPGAAVKVSIDSNPDAVYTATADAHGGFSIPLLLSAGKHAVTIDARDEAGNTTSRTKVRTVYVPDDSVPLLPQIDPLPTPVQDTTITVEGNAYAGFQVEVLRNDEAMGTVRADRQGRFLIDGVTLLPGENRIRARQLADQVDKGPYFFFLKEALSPEVLVERVDGPITRPVVEIDLPPNGSVTDGDHLPLRGSVNTAGGHVRLNGGYASTEGYGPVVDGRFASYAAVPLLPGWNTLWVEATAPDGSRGVDKVAVRSQLDPEVPHVSITMPIDGTIVYDKMVPVEGVVSGAALTVVVNEAGTGPADGRFSGAIDLFSPYTSRPDRPSVITAWAMDGQGRIGHAETTVRYKYVPAPVITVLTPAGGQVFDEPFATITGMVDNVIELTINGTQVVLTNGAFSHDVLLATGQNNFNIIAKNGPKASAATATVYYYPATEVMLQSLSVSPSPAFVAVGADRYLTATATYSNGMTADVSGASDWFFDETMLDMNMGRIKGLRGGQTTVTVQHRNLTAEVPVSVGIAGIESIKILHERVFLTQTLYSFDDPTLIAGGKTRFLAVGITPDGSMQDITHQVFWMINDRAVAELYADGYLTALKPGSASVSAQLGQISGEVVLTVKPEPIHLFITSPGTDENVDNERGIVRGIVLSKAHEVGVVVNGVPAVIYGNEFVANHVVADSDGMILAEAEDSNGAKTQAKVIVHPVESGNPLRVAASIESGTGPFETVLRIDGVPDNASPDIGYTGPRDVEFLECTDPMSCRIRLTTEGIYTFIVTSPGYDGKTYSAKIAVTVLGKAKLDALLKAKWEGMKERLTAGDVEGAVGYFLEPVRSVFYQRYIEIITELPAYVISMGEFGLVKVTNNAAVCSLDSERDGQAYSFQVLLNRDEHGKWGIFSY